MTILATYTIRHFRYRFSFCFYRFFLVNKDFQKRSGSARLDRVRWLLTGGQCQGGMSSMVVKLADSPETKLLRRCEEFSRRQSTSTCTSTVSTLGLVHWNHAVYWRTHPCRSAAPGLRFTGRLVSSVTWLRRFDTRTYCSTVCVRIIGSLPSDHYFRSVCLIVCLSVCLFACAEFFSAVFDPISIKLGHMLYVWV